MDNQVIVCVDDGGKFLEYIPKQAGHQGQGRRHLAIAVLLYNLQGQVLLQKRKHKLFDNIWDLTGATHLLHKADGQDESMEEATLRCLREEWGISPSTGSATLTTSSLRVKEIGVFNYFARDGKYCENEHCYMMVGQYDGEVNLHPEAGYEYKWMDKAKFLEDLESNPQKYTPWAKEGGKLLKQADFFDMLLYNRFSYAR